MTADVEWFEIQLAVANWNLDAALSAPAKAVPDHREKAQETCTQMLAALTNADLSLDQREQIEQRINALKVRLEALPDSH